MIPLFVHGWTLVFLATTIEHRCLLGWGQLVGWLVGCLCMCVSLIGWLVMACGRDSLGMVSFVSRGDIRP